MYLYSAEVAFSPLILSLIPLSHTLNALVPQQYFRIAVSTPQSSFFSSISTRIRSFLRWKTRLRRHALLLRTPCPPPSPPHRQHRRKSIFQPDILYHIDNMEFFFLPFSNIAFNNEEKILLDFVRYVSSTSSSFRLFFPPPTRLVSVTISY